MMISRFFCSLLAVFLCVAFLDCTPRQKYGPPTAEECITIARILVSTLSDGESNFFEQKFDPAALLSRAGRGLNLSREERAGFLVGADSLKRIAQQVIDIVQAGGSYSLLQYHLQGDEPRVLIRLLSADGALSYHDLVFLRNYETGEVAIGDIYLFHTGELLSTTVRRNLIHLAGIGEGEHTEKEDIEYADMLKAVAKMRELQQQGNLQKAIDVYERLSSSQQREKLALVTYTTIAAELGNDEYLAAINLCAREFPHDPGTLIFLLDKYALMERHQDVIATIERIDSLVDGDPYLDYLRGLHYVMLDDLQSARTAFNDAIYAEPMLEEAYIPMVDVLIRMEDYKQAVVYLNGLTHRFEKSWEDIDSYYQSAATAEPHYAEFVKSDAYELLRDQTLRREHRAHDS